MSFTSPMRPNGMRGFSRLHDFVRQYSARHRRVGNHRRYGIDPNIFRGGFDCKRARQSEDAAFGGGVVGDLGSAGARCHRREHHNPAKFLRTHETQRGATAEEIARQIDL